MKLHEFGVDLEQEEYATGFSCVRLEHDTKTGFLEMKQTWIIQHVIEAVGLDYGTTSGKYTPAEASTLVKYEDGESVSGTFN